MATTAWDDYGTGRYEKCADCMVHCGFEGTAAKDMLKNPLKAVPLMMRGVKTEGPMAPDIDLSNQRPAEYMFSAHVQQKMSEIHAAKIASTKSGAQQATAAE